MRKLFITIFAAVLAMIGVVSTPIQASAAEMISHTSVTEDLEADSSFNIEDYPYVSTDYSLQVITVAESVRKELFVYVYQPSGSSRSLVASSINISTAINDNIDFHNYKLSLT